MRLRREGLCFGVVDRWIVIAGKSGRVETPTIPCLSWMPSLRHWAPFYNPLNTQLDIQHVIFWFAKKHEASTRLPVELDSGNSYRRASVQMKCITLGASWRTRRWAPGVCDKLSCASEVPCACFFFIQSYSPPILPRVGPIGGNDRIDLRRFSSQQLWQCNLGYAQACQFWLVTTWNCFNTNV